MARNLSAWIGAFVLVAAATLLARPVEALCERQDKKGMHVQIALTGAPIVFRGNTSQKWYVSIAAAPELRFKWDFGCWAFLYGGGGWSGLSQLVYGGANTAPAAGATQQLGDAPVHAMVGFGLDVPKTGEHSGTTTSFGAFMVGAGIGNFKVREGQLETGLAFMVGFVSSLVTLNFPEDG